MNPPAMKPFQSVSTTATETSLAERTSKAMADYRKLQDALVRASADMERSQAEVAVLEAEALAEWNTSDPVELEAIAERMQAEDLEDVVRFETALAQARILYAAADVDTSSGQNAG